MVETDDGVGLGLHGGEAPRSVAASPTVTPASGDPSDAGCPPPVLPGERTERAADAPRAAAAVSTHASVVPDAMRLSRVGFLDIPNGHAVRNVSYLENDAWVDGFRGSPKYVVTPGIWLNTEPEARARRREVTEAALVELFGFTPSEDGISFLLAALDILDDQAEAGR